MNTTALLKRTAAHTISRVLHRYADFRIGATVLEKHCYKTSDSILLTFDDYGNEHQVRSILDILNQKNVRAAFFLQGDWSHDHPELVAMIASQGHIIGNHTYSHAILLGAPESKVREEIIKGLPGPWLRPPQGRYDKRIRTIARSLGYAICYWTIDSRDWTGAGTESMRHTILSELHPGATILFHLHGTHTIDLLPTLIDDIRDRGYELTSHREPMWRANYL